MTLAGLDRLHKEGASQAELQIARILTAHKATMAYLQASEGGDADVQKFTGPDNVWFISRKGIRRVGWKGGGSRKEPGGVGRAVSAAQSSHSWLSFVSVTTPRLSLSKACPYVRMIGLKIQANAPLPFFAAAAWQLHQKLTNQPYQAATIFSYFTLVMLTLADQNQGRSPDMHSHDELSVRYC